MALLSKLQELVAELTKLQSTDGKQNEDQVMTFMENVNHLPQRQERRSAPVKRAYVRKDPEKVRLQREGNVLINRLSRGVRTREKYEQDLIQSKEWMDLIQERFPHLQSRAESLYQTLLKDFPEAVRFSNPKMEVDESPAREESRKRRASEGDEMEEKASLMPMQPSGLTMTPLPKSEETLIVAQGEQGQWVKAQALTQNVNDGRAHNITPVDYREAMKALFRQKNK